MGDKIMESRTHNPRMEEYRVKREDGNII